MPLPSDKNLSALLDERRTFPPSAEFKQHAAWNDPAIYDRAAKDPEGFWAAGIHFPLGVTNASNVALYGIEKTNRGCTLSTNFIAGQSVPPARSISVATTGLGVATG